MKSPCYYRVVTESPNQFPENSREQGILQERPTDLTQTDEIHSTRAINALDSDNLDSHPGNAQKAS